MSRTNAELVIDMRALKTRLQVYLGTADPDANGIRIPMDEYLRICDILSEAVSSLRDADRTAEIQLANEIKDLLDQRLKP